jgi:DNA polymerase
MDNRRTLEVLQEEWEECTKCELGIRREDTRGKFVFGEGVLRGVMFVGEGPGREEEAHGRPFLGPSGSYLRVTLQRLGLQDYYLTNCVACRSCAPATDTAGNVLLNKKGNPIIRDEAPLPIHMQTCLSRLHEEIYMVDPIVIVSLGAKAAETLSGKNIAILDAQGKEMEITIPGAGRRASLTDKRRLWGRKLDGQMTWPTEQEEVKYLMIPTVHPAYVLRKSEDRGPRSPARLFMEHIKHAVKLYETYLQEVYGVIPSGASDADYESLMESEEQDD